MKIVAAMGARALLSGDAAGSLMKRIPMPRASGEHDREHRIILLGATAYVLGVAALALIVVASFLGRGL